MALGKSAPTKIAERQRLVNARLVAQGLTAPAATNPAQLLADFGAMQGQDIPGLLSSVALRLDPAACAQWVREQADTRPEIAGVDPRIARVLAAFADGEIVRGYPMRNTVFGLAAADARWITDLCVRPLLLNEKWLQARGLPPNTVDRAREITVAHLKQHPGGLSRRELCSVWEAAGINTANGAGYGVICYLIETGLLVYGPHNGRDNDVVLAETWLPSGSGLVARFNGDRISATAELLRRYLRSHGPATLRDFAWWTKLPFREINPAFEQIFGEVERWGTDAAGEALYCRPGLNEAVAGTRPQDLAAQRACKRFPSL